MQHTSRVMLTGNLVYIDSLEEALKTTGISTERIEVMRLERAAGPADLKQALQEFKIENIVCSRPEHAGMYLDLIDETSRDLLLQNVIHFVPDSRSFRMLDQAGLPVLQSPGEKSIDMVEFFLRLNRTGPVLTPCVDPALEEIPEFLAELKFDSRYLRMYEAKPFDKEVLENKREQFYKNQHGFTHVLLQEPGTLTQFLVAFPDAKTDELIFIPLHAKTVPRLDHLGLKRTDVVQWHPDRPESFSQQLNSLLHSSS